MSVSLYSVKQYTPFSFKIVELKRRIDTSERLHSHHAAGLSVPSLYDDPPSKFESSLSRAKAQVYQYALCNDWDWFCTFTLDKKLRDRFDLKGFNRDLSRFLRNYRRQAPDLRFLLIPEQHKDGAWHMHGLIAGLPEELLSPFCIEDLRPWFGRRRRSKLQKLHDKGYLNWPDYAKRFGFVSMGRIRSPEACARYVTKYISKSMSARVFDVGSHLYYASRGLKRAERVLFDWYFTPDNFNDAVLRFNTEFCRCGWLYGDWDGIRSLFTQPDPSAFEVTQDDFTAVVDPDDPWTVREVPWSEIQANYQMKIEVCYDSQENQGSQGQGETGTLHCRTCGGLPDGHGPFV